MSIVIGMTAGDFTAPAVLPNNSFDFEFNLTKHLEGQRGILFFYPFDFSFICPTEILAIENRKAKFKALDTKIIFISTDSHLSHLAWKQRAIEYGGIGKISFPMVSDLNREISKNYGALNPNNFNYRTTIIMDKDQRIRHQSYYDIQHGRNIDEFLRIIEMMDHTATTKKVCPAGWTKDKDSLTPDTQGVADYLSKNAMNL